MQKILLAAITVIFYFLNVFAQDTADVSIPLEIFDNGGGWRTLYFGVDSTATDSLDINLGESDLPPFPPTGVFEARWILPENNFSGSLSSYRDYRYAPAGIFQDTLEYRLKYQGADDADTMFFQWDLPIDITARLQDLITGTIVNVFMSDSGVFGLTNFSILNQMKFLVYYNIIPVELMSFTAEVIGNDVMLNWRTATELNNQGFEIERVNNGTFQWIGYVTGFGTTTEPKSYSFTDENLTSGIYAYRLKQIDYDGTFEYSNEINVEVDFTPKEFVLYQNYPNPFNPVTTIEYSVPVDGFVSLNVYNAIGQKVAELVNGEVDAGSYEVKFDATDLSSGIYFYKIEAGSFVDVKKMILIR